MHKSKGNVEKYNNVQMSDFMQREKTKLNTRKVKKVERA